MKDSINFSANYTQDQDLLTSFVEVRHSVYVMSGEASTVHWIAHDREHEEGESLGGLKVFYIAEQRNYKPLSGREAAKKQYNAILSSFPC